jgi:hypothetical protein
VNVACVDPAEVHRFWPLASDLIRRAMTRTKLGNLAPVERSVLAGEALLWVIHHEQALYGAVVTQLEEVDGDKYCTIVACAGEDSPRWLHLIARIEAFGKAEGCKAMRIFGRKGWARVLPDYRTHALVLQKELT